MKSKKMSVLASLIWKPGILRFLRRLRYGVVDLKMNRPSLVLMSSSSHPIRSSRLEFSALNSLAKNSGFTLVELLVSMGLISILLVSLTSIFTASLELQLRSEATSSRQEDAQFILSRIFYDVNQASTITTPASIDTQTNTLVLTVNGDTWTYALTNGDLVVTNSAGSFRLNSYLTQVTQFDVKRVGNTTGKASVQVALTVGSRIAGSPGSSSVSYTTTFSKW